MRIPGRDLSSSDGKKPEDTSTVSCSVCWHETSSPLPMLQEPGERTKYVEIAPKSGWQTMAKTVRETDEERIRDTKEDIDTLLVFVRFLIATLPISD